MKSQVLIRSMLLVMFVTVTSSTVTKSNNNIPTPGVPVNRKYAWVRPGKLFRRMQLTIDGLQEKINASGGLSTRYSL